MPVHWKKLCALGALFWASMTAYDYLFGSIIVPGEFKGHDINVPNMHQDILSTTEEEIEDVGWSYWTYTLTILSIATLFTISYMGFTYYPRKELSKSKELINANEAVCTALFNVAYDTSEPSGEDIVIIHENTCDCTSQYCKTKEEFSEVSFSTKEIAALNKKIEIMNEEKRNLTRFLAQSEKDNRTIKQKMMEVLRDKNVLLKRLEAATREIRSNTVARQATLDKLEESLQYSNQLKVQIQEVSAERSELVRKLRQVETQCKNMKRQQDTKTLACKRSNNGMKSPTNVKSVDSVKDIEQIELKLHDLEASLEKMKGKPPKSEEYDTDENDTTSECSEPKILRQVSSSDMNFLSEVEPSYTNLLAKYDSDSGAGALGLHQQVVESIVPAEAAYYGKQDKFAVPHTFGSVVFSMFKHIHQRQRQRQQGADSVSDDSSVQQMRDPVVVNYAIVCNYKCPYAERLAMLGSCYFGRRQVKAAAAADDDDEEGDSNQGAEKNYGCKELVRYEQLPEDTL